MSCFLDALTAIVVWRFFSSLQKSSIAASVENRLRENIKEEYLKTEEEMSK